MSLYFCVFFSYFFLIFLAMLIIIFKNGLNRFTEVYKSI